MKKAQDSVEQKVPAVIIDHSLDQYQNKVLFPAKLAKANEMLKTAKLPAKRRRG